jgi:adenylate cyclase
VAGVIGKRKFVYDVRGDTANVASRLETSAEPDSIHVSEPVAQALRVAFDLGGARARRAREWVRR